MESTDPIPEKLLYKIRSEEYSLEIDIDEDGYFVIYVIAPGTECEIYRGDFDHRDPMTEIDELKKKLYNNHPKEADMAKSKKRKKKGKVICKKDRNGQYSVTYKSSNGRILANARGLNNMAIAKNNLEALQNTDFVWPDEEE